MRVNQHFIPFIHHVWGETVLWGTVFIIQTSDRMQYFTILQYKVHSFNIQDDRSTHGLLAKALKKKFRNHLYGQPVLTFAARAVVKKLTPNVPFLMTSRLFCRQLNSAFLRRSSFVSFLSHVLVFQEVKKGQSLLSLSHDEKVIVYSPCRDLVTTKWATAVPIFFSTLHFSIEVEM